MPIIELNNSRTISYQEGNPVGIREFHVFPYISESAVQALFGNGLPAKFSEWPTLSVSMNVPPTVRLVAKDYEITRDLNVTDAWHVRVIYKDGTGPLLKPNLQPADDGYLNLRLSSEARLVDAWRQYNTNASFVAALNAKTDDSYRPLFAVGTPQSDICGVKIDVAGYPTSIMRPIQRVIVDITTTQFPSLKDLRIFLGTRNVYTFLGIEPHTAVFTGGEASQMQPGRWILSLNFDVDYQYHLQQVVGRNASGYAQTDAGGESTALTTGQAAIVSWVQPFPRVTNHKNIHPALAST